MNEILLSVIMFTAVVFILVLAILFAKNHLTGGDTVRLNINGKKDVDVSPGNKLLNVLAGQGLFVSSACEEEVPAGNAVYRFSKEEGASWPQNLPILQKKRPEQDSASLAK